MKRQADTGRKEQFRLYLPLKQLYVIVLFTSILLPSLSSYAQVRQLIQVKTFDEQLQPMKNVEVSINNKEYISTGSKGVVFTELIEHELPIKTIKIKNEQFEPAAWNYSKSILEIVIRKKNYQLVNVTVKDQDKTPLPNLPVTFKGKKTSTATTNAEGKFEIPLALDEKINSAGQFSVKGYEVVDLKLSDRENVVTVEPIKPVVTTSPSQETPIASNKATSTHPMPNTPYFRDFDISKLDSVQSLTVFYSLFKNIEVNNMDEATKQKLDLKFSELVLHLQDSLQKTEDVFMGKISDSSFVSEDIKNLLKQATAENKILQNQRAEFNEKIKIIDQKLENGITNLDEETRAKLLSDLMALEQLLTENENRFYKNLNDYRQVVNSLKERYFDFKSLENKLSESEAKRLEEQRTFRKQLIGISVVVVAFALLIILLITFSSRLRKQKKELVVANAEVKRINENLEGIVLDRTKELAEANRELDTFLYRASHDLRSPVCSIIGLCNIAINLSNGEPRELVKRVAYTTEGMDKLLKKLSIISEINQPSGYSSITLLDLVENIQHKSANGTSNKQVDFKVDCPADLVLYSYPNLIDVIITNLVENAFFYSLMREPQGARVEFKAAIKGDQVEFSVHDNGIGVDETIRHRLFDMFFKGHADSKGNGLGLYIVQKSVQALDGNIVIESEQGSYTRFTVRIPLHKVPLSEKLEPAAAL